MLERFLMARVDLVTDGVRDHRLVVDEPDRVRLCGEVWAIAQTRHVFWLDLERAPGAAGDIDWTLFFDLVAPERRARNAVYGLVDPAHETWRIRRSGRASPGRPR